MNLKPAEKPTFQQIRAQTKTVDGQTITRQLLAEKARLLYSEVYIFDIGGHLAEAKIKKVLRAFNDLSGCILTVNDMKHGGHH